MRIRSIITGLLAAFTLLAGTACLDPGDPVEPEFGAMIRFVNATSTPLDVLFDGHVVLEALPATRHSAQYVMDPGARTIGFRTPGGATATATVTAEAFQTFTAIGLPGNGSTPVVTEVRPDTNAIPVANSSKVRVIHAAPSAPPVEIWRTQPDFEEPVRVVTPFTYGSSSNYILSDPGSWRFWLTPVAGGDTLADTGPFQITGGGLATVFLMDSAGVMVLRVVR